MVQAANLGFPRIGAFRELKKAVESFWKGASSEAALMHTAAELRAKHWKLQADAGIEFIPSNDFSFYDQVLDTIAMVGAVPARYNFKGGNVDTATYFAMARGEQANGVDVTAMEMTKWFDTNYHYIVPEFTKDTTFTLSSTKAVDEFKEAKALGIHTRPVLVGPLTFLNSGKLRDETVTWESLTKALVPVYIEVLKQLEAAGATHVQLDEPVLVKDICEGMKEAFNHVYAAFAQATKLNITVATYFGALGDNLDVAVNLPVAALHIDAVRGKAQLADVLAKLPADKTLSVGVIDGRNIWKTDFAAAESLIAQAVAKLGADRVVVAPSCSLLHTPVDLDSETKLDAELKNWLAFAKQKLAEVSVLTAAANGKKDAAAFADNAAAMQSRRTSKRIHNDAVKARLAAVTEDMKNRRSPYSERAKVQRALLQFPLLPTTTIGSFPQTAEVRAARAKHKAGELNDAQYKTFLQEETVRCIRIQEELGIDVLVHGEFERNDMVEYFGEQLAGFTFTAFGWVQSYGSRCVKPPVIFGDVSRPNKMTVEWATFSQENTKKVMKGMLTGPVTILQWSFVRDDQPEADTCAQIALAIRDEVQDLEAAGIKVIQIDEAALREGLPLRKSEWAQYLQWSVDAFRLTASGVKDTTQIHTHMCYSEFNDIIEGVARMDADVISIETSRSQMELLDAFVNFKYPNDIGPGVYDIHSPRVPSQAEMEALLEKALKVLSPEQIWVNPDCGLKTRGWPEVKEALKGMVAAAAAQRAKLGNGAKASA
jgi:5-methyltetrahydropteroyltriglutamate--homocysteine methyltransferase